MNEVAGHHETDGSVRLPGWAYRVLRGLTHLICRGYWRVEVSYESELPESGPVILTPVHRSFLDFFVVSEVTKRKIFYMAKDELWRSKPLGAFLESVGAFRVDRESADRTALSTAQRVLERGDVLILFPEGTRRAGTSVEDLQEGAAFLSARTGAPVVCVGIGGTELAMPKGSKIPRPVKVRIVVGAPLVPPKRSERGRVPRSQVHAMTESIALELQRLYDEARSNIPGYSSGPG